MAAYVNTFLNQVRENVAPAEQQRQTREVLNRAEWIKVAASVGLAACSLLFAASYFGASCLLLLPAYVCYEIATLAHNYQKILETGLKTILPERIFLAQLTERAPISRSIARLTGYY